MLLSISHHRETISDDGYTVSVLDRARAAVKKRESLQRPSRPSDDHFGCCVLQYSSISIFISARKAAFNIHIPRASRTKSKALRGR